MRRRLARKQRSAYRRYDASAAAAPSLHTISQAAARELNRPRLVSGLILLTVIILGLWIWLSEDFYIMQPSVTGNPRVPTEEITSASQISALHVFWVNAAEVETRLLESIPSLRETHLSCALPASCTIAIEERQPLLTWKRGQSVVWIDESGAVFTTHDTMSTLLTVESTDATVQLPGERLDTKLMAAILSSAYALPEVQSFRYSAERGLEFDAPRGYAVYLGVGSNMNERVSVWRALHAQLEQQGVQPKYIDVRFALAPFYEK